MRSRGVLDRPVKPGDDTFDCGGRLTQPQFLPGSQRIGAKRRPMTGSATKQSSFLCGFTKAGLLRCARNDGFKWAALPVNQ
jgi:hypothetical protein